MAMNCIAFRNIALFLSCAMCYLGLGQKSELTISSPTSGTVWVVEEKAALQWEVAHIAPEKSIRFFLVRNETVVQELGSFPNTGFKDNITLAKNIGSGDRYQVVGIELFPDDKFNVAKFITPIFSIENRASDARKRQNALKNATTAQSKKDKKSRISRKDRKRKKVKKTKNPDKKRQAEQAPIAQMPPPAIQRTEFDGRKISYTKELEFSSEEITVKIWDHGRQDGDIVSIYINGKSVVSKYYLTYWKKEFKITLDPTVSNDLFLYAHNLGDAPPNTVAVEISDGKKSENIVLNSDLKSCEAVMISVK